MFVLWLGVQFVQRQLDASGTAYGLASAIESIGAGWLLAVLCGLAWWSGMTFLVGSTFQGNIVSDIARELGARQRAGWGPRFAQPAASVLLAAAAAWVGASAWPSLRRTWCVGCAAILLVLCWFMPALGAIVLALAVCLTRQRWLLASAAAAAFAWAIGAFYYALALPLGQKALILFVAGATLVALAWYAMHSEDGTASDAAREAGAEGAMPARLGQLPAAGIALALVASLALANYAIWDKESVIRGGRPVFVELAPVDPRSLMQGDYMALDFRMPFDAEASERMLTWGRPQVIAQLDEKGIAKLVRIHKPGVPLGAGEIPIELTPKNGRWTLVTDAWFFREGDGQRWSAARYGEFRVAPDGKALLVGMADARLQPIPR
jgi:uncharacterized membrane-anchored protein